MTSHRALRSILKPRTFALFLPLLFFVLSLSACSDVPNSAPAPEPEAFRFGGSLYVTNGADGSLLVFDGQDDDGDGTVNNNDLCPSTPSGSSVDSSGCAASQKNAATIKATNTPTPRLQEGNITPTRRYPESVAAPSSIFLDRVNDTLYVANTGQNAIAIYENASTLTPPVAATRVIVGDKTLLDKPFGVTYDAVNNRIFAANRDSNSVVVFDLSCAGSLAGNIAPCRRLIIAGQTPPSFPRSLAIDTLRNLLYVSTTGNDSILVYENPGNIGGSPAQCITTFVPCTAAPNRVIGPHNSNEDASKLELPFGIYIDNQNDRLYVANTGLNTPAILIYENASTRNSASGEEIPERVIAGLNTQLTVPAGIDVDVDTGEVYVINNNSPNNLNQSAGNNVDSPSLVVFNDILNACTTTTHLCNLTPDNRIGGDVSPEAGTTLASPIGVAIDPLRKITYIANTGGNNILFYGLAGNIGPVKLNAGVTTQGGNDLFPQDATNLEEPSSIFYDDGLDRLYITNFGNTNNLAAAIPIIVYDKASTLTFSNTPPSWTIGKDPSLSVMRGIYLDKTRGYLLTLSASPLLNMSQDGSKFSLYCIPLSSGVFNTECTNAAVGDPTILWNNFPINPTGPTGTQLTPPTRFDGFIAGLTLGGPTAMTVDQDRGHVYIADKGANAIFIYDLNTRSLEPAIIGASTTLNQPHGLTYDSTKDILYVTNAGNNTLLSFDDISTKNGNVAPNRILTTSTLSLDNKLQTPMAPAIDTVTNELFLINSGQNAIFTYENADLLEGEKKPDKKILGSASLLDFSPPVEASRKTGALLATNIKGKQQIFIGQPESPVCDVSNCPTGALMVFGIQGKVTPGKVWSGVDDGFSLPSGVSVDPTRDVLYVINQATNTLSRFNTASQVNVTTTKTDLSNIQLDSPAGLLVDSSENRLYVSNAASILAFNEASTLSEGSSPSQTITHAQLSNPRGLDLDTLGKRLYVASTGNDSILVFNVDGNAVFDAALNGSNTQLNNPLDVAIDATRNLLYVLNGGGTTEILVFEGTLSGNVAPTRVIRGGDQDATNIAGDPGGNNFMVSPSALFVDPTLDLLYLSDPGAEAVFFFFDASTINGRPGNIKTLSGDNTGLNQPSALFVDTSHSP